MPRRYILPLIVCLYLCSCSSAVSKVDPTTTPGVAVVDNTQAPTLVKPTAAPTAALDPVDSDFACSWLPVDGLPLEISTQAAQIVSIICQPYSGNVSISLSRPALRSDLEARADVEWAYVVAARFPTVADDISLASIQLCWLGRLESCPNQKPILGSNETIQVFTWIWGNPGRLTVRPVEESQLLETAWGADQNWAILPFESLQPRWKVMRVDGLHPLHMQDAQKYPLSVVWAWTSSHNENIIRFIHKIDLLKASITNLNYGELTSLAMTGTTALTRGTALLMAEKGVLYPASDIGALLNSADITHISNEVSFLDGCPEPSDKRKGVRFCSQPAYIQLLEAVGADVIELTGNHLNDWGRQAFEFSLDLYQEQGMPYYGGGLNLQEARLALTMEDHGNRLAFIGCNLMGPADDWATVDLAGSAPCDFDWMETEVKQLTQDGYLVIVTLQHFEVTRYLPQSSQKTDFLRMAEAGAVIVSGSQAHYPQVVTFDGNHLVHYGLGNLFFDQMDGNNQRAFIDIHSFYQGRLISTELVTIQMEEGGKPRLMSVDERQALLTDIFTANGW
jgi:hypothetical protein